MYYWLTFLNQVRFLNFQHFFCSDFETNFTGVFFRDSKHFPTFYPLWRRNRILFIFFMILNIFWVNDLPLKSDQIEFLFQKDAQCSEIYRNNFPIFYFLRNVRFFIKRNHPKRNVQYSETYKKTVFWFLLKILRK